MYERIKRFLLHLGMISCIVLCFKGSSQLLRWTWISVPARYPVNGCTVRALWSMAANPVNPAQESFLIVAENERVGGRVC